MYVSEDLFAYLSRGVPSLQLNVKTTKARQTVWNKQYENS